MGNKPSSKNDALDDEDAFDRLLFVRENVADLFKAIDTDKSGFLDKGELIFFYKKIGFAEKFAEDYIDDLDENGDGKLSFDEYFHSILRTVFNFEGNPSSSQELNHFFNAKDEMEYNQEISRLSMKLHEALGSAEIAAIAYEAEMRNLLNSEETEMATPMAPKYREIFGEHDVDAGSYTGPKFADRIRKAVLNATNAPCVRLRGLCWRVSLGLLSGAKDTWAEQLRIQTQKYDALKAVESHVTGDAAANDVQAGTIGGTVFMRCEAVAESDSSLIVFDLHRLFITGIHEDFFKMAYRQTALKCVLQTWATHNADVAYRQGMHEIAGIILYCLEEERVGWTQAVDIGDIDEHEPLAAVLAAGPQSATLEAHMYFIFEAVMRDLKVLYDPSMVTAPDGTQVSPVVAFCRRVQEEWLSAMDPELARHLDAVGVAPQLYGMRWSRLLLSRELPVSNGLCLRLWDYLFASAVSFGGSIASDADTAVGASSGDEERERGGTNEKAFRRRLDAPLLVALGHVIMAMLVQIREEFLESDSNGAMMLAMRYPVQAKKSIGTIIELAESLSR